MLEVVPTVGIDLVHGTDRVRRKICGLAGRAGFDQPTPIRVRYEKYGRKHA